MHRLVWAVQGLGVLLVGLFMAMGFNGVFASILVGQPAPAAGGGATSPPASSSADPQMVESGALEGQRNIFNYAANLASAPAEVTDATDPSKPDETTDPEKPTDETPLAPPAPVSPLDPQPTDLPLTLIGTQVANEARWSIAIVKANEGGGEKTFYVRVHQVLLDDAEVVQIVRDRVYFRRSSKNGQIEYVSIDADPAEALARAAKKASEAKPAEDAASKPPEDAASKPPSDASTPPANSAKTDAPPASGDALDPSRIKVVDGNVVVPRDMADAIRKNQNLLKDPRFGPPPQLSPYYRNKKIEGFKLMGLQQGSIFSTLGLQNTDIIMNINGELVDKPQKAMALFDTLKPGEDVKVKVNRKGKIQVLTFKLD
jgi:type II secretory pathway component PulC